MWLLSLNLVQYDTAQVASPLARGSSPTHVSASSEGGFLSPLGLVVIFLSSEADVGFFFVFLHAACLLRNYSSPYFYVFHLKRVFFVSLLGGRDVLVLLDSCFVLIHVRVRRFFVLARCITSPQVVCVSHNVVVCPFSGFILGVNVLAVFGLCSGCVGVLVCLCACVMSVRLRNSASTG